MDVEDIEKKINEQMDKTLEKTEFSDLGELYRGKVRDNYTQGKKRIIISSDRLSAFDRVITTIPFKGQMLNQMSAFWFEKTKNIVKNHLIEVPDPNVSVTRQCETIPIEIIIRAYLTGTAWRNYKKGKPTSGLMPPEGLKKNEKLEEILVTPSTKAESGHDIYISKDKIIRDKIVDKDTYQAMEKAALKLFEYGQEYCKKNGLILVDTKYEFGIYDGELMVIDEIHTPDSSRFWILDTYEERFSKGEEPEILDKEIFRGWLMENYPEIFPDIKPEQDIPKITDEIKITLAKRYMRSFERITGLEFEANVGDVSERIRKNLKNAGYF